MFCGFRASAPPDSPNPRPHRPLRNRMRVPTGGGSGASLRQSARQTTRRCIDRLATKLAAACARMSPGRIRTSAAFTFTRLELLVLLVILAVLVGLVVPLISGAVRQARRIGWVSYLKQIGLAARAGGFTKGFLFPNHPGAPERSVSGASEVSIDTHSNALSS